MGIEEQTQSSLWEPIACEQGKGMSLGPAGCLSRAELWGSTSERGGLWASSWLVHSFFKYIASGLMSYYQDKNSCFACSGL